MNEQAQKKRLFAALGSKAYDRALSVANAIVSAPRRLLGLIQKGRDKAFARLQSAGKNIVADTHAGLRLLQSFAEGRYREVSTDNLVLLIAAMAYFVAPIDAIPDFFLGIGITDDLALLSWTFAKLREELEYFKAWEARNQALTPEHDSLPNPITPSDAHPNDTKG